MMTAENAVCISDDKIYRICTNVDRYCRDRTNVDL